MIKSLTDARILDGLPRILAGQAWAKALSEAMGIVHEMTMGYADSSQIYTNIDNATESILDALAVNWKIDWYDTDYSLEQKRRIVKTALTVRRTMGTVAAVKAQTEAIYPGSTLEEWFEYDGEPGRFRMRVNIVTVEEQQKFAAMSMEEIERRLAAAKRFSAHLEEVEYYDAGGTAKAYGMAAYLAAQFEDGCTTMRVNPSPDTAKGTAIEYAMAACIGQAFTADCVTMRVNPSPDDARGTAVAYAFVEAIGTEIIDYGTTENG